MRYKELPDWVKEQKRQIRKEMGIFPVTFVENIGILPRQHIAIFRK